MATNAIGRSGRVEQKLDPTWPIACSFSRRHEHGSTSTNDARLPELLVAYDPICLDRHNLQRVPISTPQGEERRHVAVKGDELALMPDA